MAEVKEVKIGQKVPDFKMTYYDPTTKGFGSINLYDLLQQGKWVVFFFYPADYTFVCPTELADVGDKYDILKKMNVEVISVSTDTHYVHLAWTKDEPLLKNFKWKMAADPTGFISRTFGVYDEATGLALRGSFIINPDGILVGSEINHYAVGRDSDELVRKIEAFQYVREHPDEACPAKWEKGKKTLKPGPDIVGRVGEVLAK
ncbi:MAG: redoxin domain-containing protein [bacterium]|nr:redoxin domain-containing protein [bacterium]